MRHWGNKMIVNVDSVPNKIAIKNHLIAEWLLFYARIPLLGIKNNVAYFADTEVLKKALNEMPFYLKILMKIN